MKYLRIITLTFILLFSHRYLLAQPDNQLLFNPPEKTNNYVFKSTARTPEITFRVHKNGRFWNTVNNNGIIGNFFSFTDPDLHKSAPKYYFPRYSRIRHGYYTGLWVGGVVDNDTLVSTSVDVDYEGWWTEYRNEFWPDFYPSGDFTELTPMPPTPFSNNLASSQTTYQAIFTDTFQFDSFVPYNSYDMRYHIPLNIKVTQTSYSWSYNYAEDFIIVDYKITNLGSTMIKDAFLGLYHVGAVHHIGELPYPRLDDLEGYIDSIPYEFEELGNEPMNLSWVCDKDGYPQGSNWNLLSTKNCFGLAPLKTPEGANIKNFNWWVSGYGSGSWGPRKMGTLEEPLRYFYGELGEPHGDLNKYYMMSFPEVDYSGYEAVKNHVSDGWMGPSEYAGDLADGHYVHFLTSFGPFDIPPFEAENVTVVYSIGESIHTNPSAFRDYFDPLDPQSFLDYLNYDDLINNIRWAKRIYDNPGVDTDGDGDSGKYFFYHDPVMEESLQVYYAGDGVPDYRGATPPPAPQIRIITEQGKLIVRWNGRQTERYFDTFSLIRDFEGYRVYLARSLDENDISLLASYDREDYNRYIWNQRRESYELKEIPYTLDSLRVLYGESFLPLEHSRVNPLILDGNIYYFTKVDYNVSDINDPVQIHKLYPEATMDTSDVDEEGRMRYYEYEYIIDDLLPTVPYYVAVTAFDFGYPAKSLEPLESSPLENIFEVFAIKRGAEVLEDGELNVYCYPNPYRADEYYDLQGFENRFTDLAQDRARSIFFANLPEKCTISIYSIDGDLIKRIDHNELPGSGRAAIERFDMITRNTQAIVSGLYYWVVESAYGNQIGKLTIIR
ncbi:MAG: hypothetical protein ACE5D6_01045 [Candidatus Zixiibacteriota bacterium]